MENNKNQSGMIFGLGQAIVSWTPLVALVLATIFSSVMIFLFLDCADNATFCKNPFTPQVSAILGNGEEPLPLGTFAELSGRLGWMISVLIFFVSIICTFGVALNTIKNSLNSEKLILGSFLAVFVTVFAFSSLAVFSKDYAFNDEFLGKTVYVVSNAKYLVDIVQGLGLSGLVVVAFSLSILLRRACEDLENAGETMATSRAAKIGVYQDRVRLLLYVSAFSLVAGTLQSSALYSWAISMLQTDVQQAQNLAAIKYFDDGDDIPATMTFLNGSFYSILLATAFLPAIFRLKTLAYNLAKEALPNDPPQSQKQWLSEHASEESLFQIVVSITAMLAPLLAGGPLASAIGLLS